MLFLKPRSPDSLVGITFNVLRIMEWSDDLGDHVDDLFDLFVRKQNPIKRRGFLKTSFLCFQLNPEICTHQYTLYH